jgi:hypothetical protein
MSLDREKNEPPTPMYSPDSPPCHQDRLAKDLAIHSRNKHATQLLPEQDIFGHGDPLMAAVIENWKRQASDESRHRLLTRNIEIEDKRSFRRYHRHRRTRQTSLPDLSSFQLLRREQEEKEIQFDHLIEHGTPFAGIGMNDVVHLKDGTVLSVPCLSPELIHQVTTHKTRRGGNQRRYSMPHLFWTKNNHKTKDGLPPRGSETAFSVVTKHIGHGTIFPLH